MQKMNNLKLISMGLLLYSVLIFSCGADESEKGQNQLVAEYSSIQENVINKYCANSDCHEGSVPNSRLNLEEGNAYENLVNVKSTQIQNLFLVKPNSPDSSYFIRKLENNRIVGEPMPMGKPPLPQDTIDTIRTWIENGAPNN